MAAADPLLPTSRSSGDSNGNSTAPLMIVFVASVVLLLSTGASYGWNDGGSYYIYATSIPTIAILLSLVSIPLPPTYGKHVNMVLFVYSFIGACFLTFHAPFTATGNGYFAAWAIAYGSSAAMGMDLDEAESAIKGIGSVMGMAVSSLVVIVASIYPFKQAVDMERISAILALSVGSLSLFFSLLTVALDKCKTLNVTFNFVATTLLAIFWIVTAFFVTIVGPFTETGNGYFATWAGAMMASSAAFTAKEVMFGN